jgi:hypothetical protein
MKTFDKQSVLIELQYLPSIEFFSCIQSYNEVIFESNENFVKQSYRNRSYILGSNKTEMLVIPVIDGNKKILIKDLKIDFSQRWDINHWRTMNAAYGKSPFYEFYSDYFKSIYEKKHSFLWDFNFEILTMCLKLLRINKTIRQTSYYEKEVNSTVFDARNLISPKNKSNSSKFYQTSPYQQNFGNEFVPNLSIIDLLFCRGNQALEILKKSKPI